MKHKLIDSQAPDGDRLCMFCGQALANRGEAYYDHLQDTVACHDAWVEWTERIDQDRNSGG